MIKVCLNKYSVSQLDLNSRLIFDIYCLGMSSQSANAIEYKAYIDGWNAFESKNEAVQHLEYMHKLYLRASRFNAKFESISLNLVKIYCRTNTLLYIGFLDSFSAWCARV